MGGARWEYHMRVECISIPPPSTQGYGPSFVHKVEQRHVLAKNYFSRLPQFSDQMQRKVKEIPFLKGPERVIVLPTRQKEEEEARKELET